MKQLITLSAIAFIFVFSACKTTIGFNVLEPAIVNIPPELKKVVLINRTKPDKLKPYNQLEQVVSGEWAKEDGKAAFKCLNGLGVNMAGSMRQYQTIIIKDTVLVGSGDKVFPEPLRKSFIDSICKKYGADFVVSLEVFDTSILNKATGLPATLSVMTMTSVITGPSFTLMSSITSGFRVYAPHANNMYDQYLERTNFDFASMQITDQEVLLHLPHALDGIYRNASICGENYGYRLSPHSMTRSRFIYTKGNWELKKAYRYAMLNKWDEANVIWANQSNSGKRKVAYRALYNMAVYQEKNGNIDAAVQFAGKAYIDYRKRQALYYKNDLEYVKAMREKANEQLNTINNEQQNNGNGQ